MSGVQFTVTTGSGELVAVADGMISSNGVYYTDASGDFMVTGLDPGLTVTVRETKTVDGYVLDGTPHGVFCQGKLSHAISARRSIVLSPKCS